MDLHTEKEREEKESNCNQADLIYDDKLSLQAGTHLHWCQMTADCTTATTRSTNTAVTATPATAEVDVH